MMSCGNVVAENWRIAPIVERAAPVRRVFLRPSLSPKRAAHKQPARLPSYILVNNWKPRGAKLELTEKQLAVIPWISDFLV